MAAFRLAILPAIGKRTSRSHGGAWRRRRHSPRCRPRSRSVRSGPPPRRGCGASWSAATRRRPRAWSSRAVSPSPSTRARSRCSLAPAEALTAAARERSGAALGEDHAVDAGRLGGAQQRAEVGRVLEVLEDQQQRVVGANRRPGEELGKVGESPLGDLQQDALVPVEAGQLAGAGSGRSARPGPTPGGRAASSSFSSGPVRAAVATSSRSAGRPAASASATGRRPPIQSLMRGR